MTHTAEQIAEHVESMVELNIENLQYCEEQDLLDDITFEINCLEEQMTVAYYKRIDEIGYAGIEPFSDEDIAEEIEVSSKTLEKFYPAIEKAFNITKLQIDEYRTKRHAEYLEYVNGN